MAIVLTIPPSPAGPLPAAITSGEAPPVLRGCAGCCVRKYCAMYAPASAGPPANCPFGPGPAARHPA